VSLVRLDGKDGDAEGGREGGRGREGLKMLNKEKEKTRGKISREGREGGREGGRARRSKA